jgi:hypothetical protein
MIKKTLYIILLFSFLISFLLFGYKVLSPETYWQRLITLSWQAILFGGFALLIGRILGYMKVKK